MATRHLARSIVLQSLYEWDFHGQQHDLIKIVERNLSEFGPGLDEPDFIWRLVKGITSHLTQIDRIIEKAAPEWPLPQIAVVDRNVLRMGIFELLYSDKDEVPRKVAINEAIEIAKNYGGLNSPKFINGVLGTIYRELGEEPQKESEGEAKAADKTLKDADIERLVGAVVFRKEDSKIYWAMVRDVFGRWTFVKGHKEIGESREKAVLREIREEIGVSGRIIGSVGQNDYPATTEDGKAVVRKVVYFLVETQEKKLTLEKSGGLEAVEWILEDEVLSRSHYEDLENIMATAREKISTLLKK